MNYVESKILEIIASLPSEGPNLDYKVIPYQIGKIKDFIIDVISMLNCEAYMYEDKFIVFGINDSKKRVGLMDNEWDDDTIWQNKIAKYIIPKPVDIRTGTVEYQNLKFGYLYISSLNDEWIYEVSEKYIPEKMEFLSKECMVPGQAYIRRGSTNEILFSKDRQRVLNKIRQSNQISYISTEGLIDQDYWSRLALLGMWDEKSRADVEAIQLITDTPYQEIQRKVKTELLNHTKHVSFSNGVWKIKDRADILTRYSELVFDAQIDSFFKLLRKCFAMDGDELDNLSTLSNEGFARGRINGDYSSVLRESLSETLAFLGNNAYIFRNCSINYIKNEIYYFLRDLLSHDTCMDYISVGNITQNLAEAYPDVFLDHLTKLVNQNNLNKLFSENATFHGYKYKLSKALCSLAMLERYFTKCINLLFILSKFDEYFLEPIETVLMPWYPQTHARLSSRIGVLKYNFDKEPDLVWKVLMKMMPGSKTSTFRNEKPNFLDIDNLSFDKENEDYSIAVLKYIELAYDVVGTDIEKMCQLINVIDDVGFDIQKEILEKINEKAIFLTEDEKEKLWNCLKDITTRHRKFRDSGWALPEERLEHIDRFAKELLPDNNHADIHRYFRKDQYQLYEDRSDYLKEENQIKEKQISILKTIYNEKKIDGVIAISHEIENKFIVGRRLVEIINDEDIKHIITVSKDITNDDLISGLLSALQIDHAIQIIMDFPDCIKSEIAAKMPLTYETYEFISGLESCNQVQYWKNVNVFGIQNLHIEEVQTAVTHLNEVDRVVDSICLLYLCSTEENMHLQPSLVVETLNIFKYKDEIEPGIEFNIQELIKWLQNCNISSEIMRSIEWKYIHLLKEYEGYIPKYLWHELTMNPEYFISIVKDMHGKVTKYSDDEKWSDHIRKCYELLYGWKLVPGTSTNGDFNTNALNQWMQVTTELADKYEITNDVWAIFGRVSFYSPKDKDGFFIDKNIVKYIQKNKEALLGYQIEAINSRGAHLVDSTGETEFAIEADYRNKAEEAEGYGLCEFADTLRNIADEYHEDGERNKREA